MKSIIFATGNKSKLAQAAWVRTYLNLPLEIIPAREKYGDAAKYTEIGQTVAEVAQAGAIDVAKRIGQIVITEDTDFRVEALNGAPGIDAGPYLLKNGRGPILKALEHETNRRAEINSAICYATPTGFSRLFVRTIHGTIAHKEAWNNFADWIAPTPENPLGGGYSCIFIPEGHTKTISELTPEEAMRWSYREQNYADAFRFIVEQKIAE